MNGFSKKKVGTLTLGEKLRKLRSERRISLSEVSRAICIQIKYLEYIEEGNYEKLPADVYVRGFLKSYADFLGLDEKILIKLFEKEKDISRNLKKGKEDSQSIFKPLEINFFSITPRRIATIFSFILILLAILFFYREVGSFANNPKLVILSPEDNWETDSASIWLEGVAERDAKVFINGQPALVYDDGSFKESLTLQEGVNQIEIKAVNRFNKEAKKFLQLVYNSEEEAKEVASEELKNETMNLRIWVDPGPVWLKVEADGGLVFSGTMLSGAVQIFEAKEEFKISSGKGEATWIQIDDQEEKQLSEESGPQKDLVFQEETDNN